MRIGLGDIFGVAAAWELAWWGRRLHNRKRLFRVAQSRALSLGRPLLVIGAPDGGVTGGYGCGDITMDIKGSACPRSIQGDITKPLPFKDESVVVFVACVLEYVIDLKSAMAEICRVSGGEAYIARVEPWTLTAFFYPHTKRILARVPECKR